MGPDPRLLGPAYSHDGKETYFEFSRRRRRWQNTAPESSVVGLHPQTAAFAAKRRVELSLPIRLLLCTDGYARAYQNYKFVSKDTWLQASSSLCDLTNNLEALRNFEETAEPELAGKKKDDATVLAVHITN